MIKDIEDKNESVKINDKELSVLRETFPSCFRVDGSFDVVKFQEQIKDKVDLVHEGYELKFLGKSYAKFLASIDTTTIIKPDSIHNEKPENRESENIYISGDNLDGLKHILKSYSGDVKCIYIDPPYNTGTDGFVYQDKFNFTADDLQKKLSIDETQAKRIIDLTKRNSASHSAWLLFMYSRLQLARDLLKSDGVIFISIDDNEQANLKLLCDDIFGEENFVGQIIVRSNSRGQTYNQIAKTHEFILVYTRSPESELFDLEKDETNNDLNLQDKIGKFNIRELRNRNPKFGKHNRPNLFYPIYVNPNNLEEGFYPISLEKSETYSVEILPLNSVGKESCWRWGTTKCLINIFENTLVSNLVGKKKNDGTFGVYEKYRKTTYKPKSIWDDNNFLTETGTVELKALGLDNVFDFPKPISLIKQVLNLSINDDDIAIDFFSGSGTTAQSVMELNKEDNGSRKFIAVQLPEVLDPKNANQKAAFDFLTSINRPTTLNYIGIERIIRAAKKIKDESGAAIDYGFKHYELCEVNPNTLDKCETFDKAALIADTSILDDFGMASVLTTWLVSDGYGFNANVKTVDLKGYTAYYCQKHLYMINPDLTQDSVAILFEKYDSEGDFNPENIVLFGYSFNEWSVNEMLKNNLKVLEKGDKELKINIDVRY